MINGLPPFSADTEVETYTKIVSGRIDFTDEFNPEIRNLIKSLCMVDQSKRMGRVKGGWKIVMEHLWFSGLSWTLLDSKKMKATYKPNHQGSSNYANSTTIGSDNAKSRVCFLNSCLQMFRK